MSSYVLLGTNIMEPEVSFSSLPPGLASQTRAARAAASGAAAGSAGPALQGPGVVPPLLAPSAPMLGSSCGPPPAKDPMPVPSSPDRPLLLPKGPSAALFSLLKTGLRQWPRWQAEGRACSRCCLQVGPMSKLLGAHRRD